MSHLSNRMGERKPRKLRDPDARVVSDSLSREPSVFFRMVYVQSLVQAGFKSNRNGGDLARAQAAA